MRWSSVIWAWGFFPWSGNFSFLVIGRIWSILNKSVDDSNGVLLGHCCCVFVCLFDFRIGPKNLNHCILAFAIKPLTWLRGQIMMVLMYPMLCMLYQQGHGQFYLSCCFNNWFLISINWQLSDLKTLFYLAQSIAFNILFLPWTFVQLHTKSLCI